MTKFFTAFLLTVVGTVLLGISGCEEVLLKPSVEEESRDDSVPSPLPVEVTQPVAVTRIEQVATTSSAVSTLGTHRSGMKPASPNRPREAIVLELTIQELQLEMELRKEHDSAKRKELEETIAELRVQRQSLYQQETKGD